MKIPIIYLKDKQAYAKREGILKMLGNPIHLARKMESDGTKLIHIIDEDAKKGLSNNFDVYDKLTYFINIQVECGEQIEIIEKLLGMKSRVVLELPTKIDLKKLIEKKRLIVGIAGADYLGKAEGVHDVIIEKPNPEKINKFKDLGKRIIVYETEYVGPKAQLWGMLMNADS